MLLHQELFFAEMVGGVVCKFRKHAFHFFAGAAFGSQQEVAKCVDDVHQAVMLFIHGGYAGDETRIPTKRFHGVPL